MKQLLFGAAATAFVAVALLGCETPGPTEPLEPGIHMQEGPEAPAPQQQPMDQQSSPGGPAPQQQPEGQELPPMEEPMDPEDMPEPDDDDSGDSLEGFEEF